MTVRGSRPHTRSGVTMYSPSGPRISMSRALTPARRRMERHLGPARYRLPSIMAVPVRSVFTLRQSHATGRRARQREHVIQVGLEQIPDRHGLAVVLPAGDGVALVQPGAAQRVPPLGRRFGHHQVAIARTRPRSRRCPSRGPHTGRGHLVPAPVMRAGQGEQAGLRDRAVRVAMADAGGVVRTPAPWAPCPCVRRPAADHGTRTPWSPRAARPRTAYSSTGTRPPDNAQSVPRPRPRPLPDRNPPAPCRGPTPAPRTRRNPGDAPPASV